MTAPTPLDQDDLAARASAAGVPVEFDADHAYATIGGRVYRARLERVAGGTQHNHGEYVPGCFRCDLSRAEVEGS